MFPDTLMLGMEIRVKVSQYVQERIKALRSQQPGQYENIACLRTNAMKYLPNLFAKGQVSESSLTAEFTNSMMILHSNFKPVVL